MSFAKVFERGGRGGGKMESLIGQFGSIVEIWTMVTAHSSG